MQVQSLLSETQHKNKRESTQRQKQGRRTPGEEGCEHPPGEEEHGKEAVKSFM